MKATTYFPPMRLQRDAWFATGAELVTRAFLANESRKGPTIEADKQTDEAMLDEAFDLTNNPSRQDERDAKWGDFRSVSVGDIVQIEGGDAYLCKSIGWAKVSRAKPVLSAEQKREQIRSILQEIVDDADDTGCDSTYVITGELIVRAKELLEG